MKKRKIIVVCGKHKHEVEIGGDIKKITVWKLGDSAKGWVPAKRHFDHFTSLLKSALEDPEKNHIVFHYGVSVKQIDV